MAKRSSDLNVLIRLPRGHPSGKIQAVTDSGSNNWKEKRKKKSSLPFLTHLPEQNKTTNKKQNNKTTAQTHKENVTELIPQQQIAAVNRVRPAWPYLLPTGQHRPAARGQQIDQQMTTKPSGTRRHQRQQQRLKLRATPDAATSPPKLISLSSPQPLLSISPPQYFFLLRDISFSLPPPPPPPASSSCPGSRQSAERAG